MAIGRYRDDPQEMDDIECEVAAEQHPEGALIIGIGLGIVLPLVLAPGLVAAGPIVGGLVGYGCGRWFKQWKVQQLRTANRSQGSE